jgi:hypothetical protein
VSRDQRLRSGRTGPGVPHLFTYVGGIDPIDRTYQILDLTARGRDEPGEGNPQFWVRRHDEYGIDPDIPDQNAPMGVTNGEPLMLGRP